MHYIIPLVISLSLLTGCAANQAQSGAGIGGLIGATVGALTFKNKVSGAAIGAGVGAALGYMVGNEMDKTDRTQVSRVLETAPSGQEVAWDNPDNHIRYHATPHPPRHHNERIERDITLRAMMPDGRCETVYARAYRQPDGTWQLIQ